MPIWFRIIVIIKADKYGSVKSFPIANLWKLRSLIINFAWMNLKIRYKGTYLGLIWMALEPTLIFLLIYTVFTSIRERTIEDFGIYLLTGIILHSIFSRGTGGGLLSLVTNRGILQSSNIQREFFPVASTVTALITLLVQVGVFFGLMPFFNFVPPWTIVFIPIVFGLLLVLILGLSYFLSIVFAYVRDIQSIWPVVVLAMFFLSPIFWYIEDANDILLSIHAVNPLGQIIELGHKIVVFGQIPPLNDWLYASLLVFIVFIIGFATFRKFEKRVMEEL